MTVPTHILMARTIEHLISEALPARLNRRWFLYGNIYPDISHYILTIPHFADQSMGFVKRLIRTLCLTPANAVGVMDPIFSLQLGMLCHYICDYFCHVHSGAFHGTMKAHIAYELRQQAYISRRPNTLRGILPAIDTDTLFDDIEKIWAWLDAEQARYLRGKHTPESDLAVAVEKASRVAASVLTLCIDNAWSSRTLPIPMAT